MNRARGNEGVDAEVFGRAQRFASGFNVLGHAARQSAGDGALERGGNLRDAVKVAFGGNRKARLQHIHAELFQGKRDLQLLPCRKALRQRLFAVAKRGVKNNDSIVVRHLLLRKKAFCSSGKGTTKPSNPFF